MDPRNERHIPSRGAESKRATAPRPGRPIEAAFGSDQSSSQLDSGPILGGRSASKHGWRGCWFFTWLAPRPSAPLEAVSRHHGPRSCSLALDVQATVGRTSVIDGKNELKCETDDLRYCVAVMSKAKFTEADVKRAVKGVIDGGGTVASVDIWPDGRISVTVKEDKHRSIDPEDDPAVSRRLL